MPLDEKVKFRYIESRAIDRKEETSVFADSFSGHKTEVNYEVFK